MNLALLLFLIALQLADIVTTYLCLTRGKGTEGNGVLAKLMAKIGLMPTLLLTKGVFIGVLVWAAPLVHPNVLILLSLFYAWVIVNNLKVLLK